MLVDLHNHTFMCGHARGTMEAQVESAVEKGLSEMGFADHLPLVYTDDRSLSMGRDELPVYVERVLALKEKYAGSITVRLGIEADYHPPSMDDIEAMLSAYPFDYVIGSVHVLRGWIFDDPRDLEKYDGIDLDEFYLEYLSSLMELAATGLYDIVAHADLVKKFDKRAGIDLGPYYEELLEQVKKAGMCYEINTSGLRWPVNEMYPEPAFVRIASGLGVPVTLGSDSHCPEDVGRDFDRAVALVRGAGYRDIATFENRKMRLLPLP